MRIFCFFLVLTTLMACGKKSGTGRSEVISEAQQCDVNGEVVSCESVYDGLGVDVLDAMVDVPATVDASTITFNQTRSMKAEGRRIDCTSSVNKGDVYRHTVNGDVLFLDTPSGSLTMTRAHGEEGIVGTWKWSGIVDGGSYQTRMMTIVKSMTRVILKVTCER